MGGWNELESRARVNQDSVNPRDRFYPRRHGAGAHVGGSDGDLPRRQRHPATLRPLHRRERRPPAAILSHKARVPVERLQEASVQDGRSTTSSANRSTKGSGSGACKGAASDGGTESGAQDSAVGLHEGGPARPAGCSCGIQQGAFAFHFSASLLASGRASPDCSCGRRCRDQGSSPLPGAESGLPQAARP